MRGYTVTNMKRKSALERRKKDISIWTTKLTETKNENTQQNIKRKITLAEKDISNLQTKLGT